MSEVERFRDEIRATDRALTAALNRRLELVAELKRYKDEHGLPFVDPERAVAAIFEALEKAGAKILALRDPTILPKAIKNEAEIAGALGHDFRSGRQSGGLSASARKAG